MPLMYYKHWLSDEEPITPRGWGVAIFSGRSEGFFCAECKKHIRFRDVYLYSFTPSGTIILHNTEECTNALREVSAVPGVSLPPFDPFGDLP